MTIKIKKEDLLNLLKQAYEEGWKGLLDMKENVAEDIVEQYLSSHVQETEQPCFYSNYVWSDHEPEIFVYSGIIASNDV